MCVFFAICESQKMQEVWITGRFAVGHCTASHCIGLYKEITSKWPKSPFALIYRDGVGGKCDAGRWSKSKTRIAGRKRFLCSSLSSWRSSSSCLQSALLLFCLFSLDCGSRCCFQWSINTARNRGFAQMCVNVALHVLYVLLLTVLYAMLQTAVCCCGVLLVQKMNQIPCTGCNGNLKLNLKC